MQLQLLHLHKEIDTLQKQHGSPHLSAIYGAGHTQSPDIMFIFMNPTGKNVSAHKDWRGLRAPWIGTKHVWQIFYEFGLLSKDVFELTQKLSSTEWTANFAADVYKDAAKKKIYITNLAKCTQEDARHVSDTVFRKYLDNTKKEIFLIRPKKIVTFGNQVSSVLLDKTVTVSKYSGNTKETLEINKIAYDVYPIYYPVGQGRRNLALARSRIKNILRGQTKIRR
jgi:hypothetical protein